MPAKMTSRGSRRCIDYEAFGDCKYGDACNRSHQVRPGRTRTVFATVARDNQEISGKVSFHPTESDSASKKQYYLLKYKVKASHGDIVELRISDKRHGNDNLRLARITKVLQRSNNVFTQIGWVDCLAYATYGDCRLGLQCSFNHRLSSATEQHFYIAKVRSISNPKSDLGCIVGVTQLNRNDEIVKYYLPHMDAWHSRNVAEGNLVIMQRSERTVLNDDGLMHYGKVSAILHETQSLDMVTIILESTTRPGFALEPPGSKNRCIVNSLSDCVRKKECKRIGIHVLAAALGSHFHKCDHLDVPHPHYPSTDYPGTTNFDANRIRVSLSMYIHSLCTKVEGPMITPVVIPSRSIFILDQAENYTDEYVKYLDILWQVFGRPARFLEDVAKSMIGSYMVDFPGSWKERYIIYQIKIAFDRYLTAYLRSQKEMYVIARNMSTSIKIPPHEQIAVPAEALDGIISTSAPLNADNTARLAILLGSAKRGVATFWEDHLSDWYVKEIFHCKQIPDKKLVIMTSPVWQTNDFVNQQITLASMISPDCAPLYSKRELLGIVSRRLETPTIIQTVVRQLSENTVNLQFCGKRGAKQGNRRVPLRTLFPTSTILQIPESDNLRPLPDSDDEHVEEIPLLVKGLTCEKYANSVSVRLSGEMVSALADSVIELGLNAAGTEQKMAELFAIEYDNPMPYESCEGGTKITLRRGVELQLQVSMQKDSDEEVNDTLRMLRFGENCHLCLMHLNHPANVFNRDRSDVRDLVSEQSLAELKEQIEENQLERYIVEGIDVEWDDMYLSSGRFCTSALCGRTKPRDLLCIRKEITRSKTEDCFVWTCHAVVAEINDREIKFLVCGLSQNQAFGMWEDGDNKFVIEVLSVAGRNQAGTEASAQILTVSQNAAPL